MPGHGEYRLDPTVGIGRTEDLPNTKISMPSRCYRRHPYPHVVGAPTSIGPVAASFTTWGIPSQSDSAMSLCCNPSTAAPSAASTSTPICPTWPTRQPLHAPGRRAGHPSR
jgi:hypothetical protein